MCLPTSASHTSSSFSWEGKVTDKITCVLLLHRWVLFSGTPQRKEYLFFHITRKSYSAIPLAKTTHFTFFICGVRPRAAPKIHKDLQTDERKSFLLVSTRIPICLEQILTFPSMPKQPPAPPRQKHLHLVKQVSFIYVQHLKTY